MASATSISVTCPSCDKVLRLSTRPAQGKKIKCPACGDPFLPDLGDGADESTAIQTKPSAKAKSASNKSAGKNPRDEDEEDGPPRKRKRDEDEKPSKKKKSAEKKSSMLIIVLLLLGGGGLFLSCGLVGLGAFVWPGFMLSKPEEKKLAAKEGKENEKEKEKEKGPEVNPPPPVIAGNHIASHIFPDAVALFGLNIKALRDSNQLEAQLNQFNAMTAMTAGGGKGPPKEFFDLVRSSDKILMSVAVDNFQPGAKPRFSIAILTSTPEAVTKFKNLPGMGAEAKLAGKYPVYRPNTRTIDLPALVAIPGDRLIVMSECTDQELTPLLDLGASSERAKTALSRLSTPVEQAHVWGAVSINEPMREMLRGLGVVPQEYQQLQPAAMALQKANGASFSVEQFPDNAMKYQINVDCQNPKDAVSVKEGGDTVKVLVGLLLNQKADLIPASLQKDFNNNLSFVVKENVASLTMQISPQTVGDLTQMAKGGNFGLFGDKGKPPGDPPFDGTKKPPFDGAKPKLDGIKDPAKIGPKVQSYKVTNLVTGKSKDNSYMFQQGKRVTITVINDLSTPSTNVNLSVFRGNMPSAVVSDNRLPTVDRNCRVEFTVLATDLYRIRVENVGGGTARSCFVTISEQ